MGRFRERASRGPSPGGDPAGRCCLAPARGTLVGTVEAATFVAAPTRFVLKCRHRPLVVQTAGTGSPVVTVVRVVIAAEAVQVLPEGETGDDR